METILALGYWPPTVCYGTKFNVCAVSALTAAPCNMLFFLKQWNGISLPEKSTCNMVFVNVCTLTSSKYGIQKCLHRRHCAREIPGNAWTSALETLRDTEELGEMNHLILQYPQ